MKNKLWKIIVSMIFITVAIAAGINIFAGSEKPDKLSENGTTTQSVDAVKPNKPVGIPVTSPTPAVPAGIEVSPDIKRILDRGKLVVGIFPKDSPFFITEPDGGLYGFDIGLAEDIARSMNVGLEFNQKASSYQELFELAAKKEVDIVISKFSITFERAKFVKFSRPYIKLRRALLVNRVEALKNNIEEYPLDYLRTAKVKIGVLTKTSYVDFAKEMFKDATIVEYEKWSDVVSALVNGEITAVMRDENEIMKLIKRNPDLALYASVYVMKDQNDYISMAVPYDSTQLLSWINTYLDFCRIDKNINDLIKEYPEVYKEGSTN